MRLDGVFLVTITVFLTCCHVVATDEQSSQIKENSDYTGMISHQGNLKEGRLLRIAPNSHDTEDRCAMSSLKKWRQMRRWVKTNEADDIVMKELGLTGQTGEALTSHLNHKRWLEFLDKVEQIWMKTLIDYDVSTATFWSSFNLEKLTAAERENFEAFKRYVRYATMYDNEIYWNQYSRYGRPTAYYGGTHEEMLVKVGIWAENNRPREYVKTFLKLGFAKKDALLANLYYTTFLELTGKKAK